MSAAGKWRFITRVALPVIAVGAAALNGIGCSASARPRSQPERHCVCVSVTIIPHIGTGTTVQQDDIERFTRYVQSVAFRQQVRQKMSEWPSTVFDIDTRLEEYNGHSRAIVLIEVRAADVSTADAARKAAMATLVKERGATVTDSSHLRLRP